MERSYLPEATVSGTRLGWFHRYPARFPPKVVFSMLENLARRLGGLPETILDPFAGTFTTAAAARRAGISSIGVELTRLGHLVGQVRLDPPAAPRDIVDTIEAWTRMQLDRRPAVPDELAKWLGHHNARALTTFLRCLDQLEEQRVRRFVSLAVSASLRSSSRWLPGSIKAQVDPAREPPDIGTALVRAARSLARDCELESSAGTSAEACAILGDARRLPIQNASVDGIVTSPPYFVTYNYFDVHRLTYLAFGWKMQQEDLVGRRYGIQSDGVGFQAPAALESWYVHEFLGESTVLGRALRLYTTHMREHAREALRVLRPGGAVAYAVANSRRLGRWFPLVAAIRDILQEAGFVECQLARRPQSGRRILPSARNPATGRFGEGHDAAVSEYIIFARRP